MSSHAPTLTFAGNGTNGKSAPKPKRPTTHTYRDTRMTAAFAPQTPGRFVFRRPLSGEFPEVYERLVSGQIIRVK